MDKTRLFCSSWRLRLPRTVDEADPTPSFSPLGVKSGGLSLALTRAPGRPRFERRAAESEGRVPRCFRSGRLRRRAAGGCQSRERSRRAIFLSESASACERAAQRRHDALLDARAHFLQEARQALCYDEMYQRPFFFSFFFFRDVDVRRRRPRLTLTKKIRT